MMMKQDSTPTTTTITTTTTNNHPTLPTVCGQCGVEERKLLHNVRLRGNFRRLCTTCVLRLHPQCFCPACLGVYDRLPPDDAVVCYKCYSASHPTCVSSPPAGTIASSRGPLPCSSCLNPNLLVLNLNRLENGNRTGVRVIDGSGARLLLAAGKIAAMSMSKAEVAAAMEAERRAKEAAYTKKRAREALDHVVRLMGREKRNVVVESNVRKVCNVSDSVVVGAVVVDGGNVVNRVGDSSEVLKALSVVPVVVDGGSVVKRVDGSNEVLKGLNVVPVVVDGGNVVNRVDGSNEVLKALSPVPVVADGGNVNRVVNSNEVLKALPVVVDGGNGVNRAEGSNEVLKALPVVVDGGNVVSRVDDSNDVLKALNAVELKDNGAMSAVVPVQGVSVEKVVGSGSQGDEVVAMEVDVGGKDSGVDSVAENVSVTKGDLVKIGPNDEEPALVENNVINPVN